MIKYFYYEVSKIDGDYITKNEKILYDEPQTNDFGYKYFVSDDITKCYVDVEKHIKFYGTLNEFKFIQDIYDKLLIENRNKKLDTL